MVSINRQEHSSGPLYKNYNRLTNQFYWKAAVVSKVRLSRNEWGLLVCIYACSYILEALEKRVVVWILGYE